MLKLSYRPHEFAEDERIKWVDFMDIKKKTYAVTTYGRVINVRTGKELKQTDKDGYRYVTLNRTGKEGRKRCCVYVHRLVANAFIMKTQEEIERGCNNINHKDLCTWNNRVDNLEWCTQYENVIHAVNNGAQIHIDEGNDDNDYVFIFISNGSCEGWIGQSGEYNNNARLTNEQVHTICRELEKRTPGSKIAEIVGLEGNSNDISIITSIRCEKRWKSISSQYNIQKTYEQKSRVILPYLRDICKMIIEGKSNDVIFNTIPHGNYDRMSFFAFVNRIRRGKTYVSLMNELLNE